MTLVSEIEKLRDSEGLIYPETLVDWADRHRSSELYKHFEWDDNEAAKRYRVWQARRLIAFYIVDPGGERRTISLSIDRSNGGGYRDLATVMSNVEMRRQAVELGLDELQRWCRRFAHLIEFKSVLAAINRAERKLRPPTLARHSPRSPDTRPEPQRPTA